jgi:hypothetical protein
MTAMLGGGGGGEPASEGKARKGGCNSELDSRMFYKGLSNPQAEV